MTTARRAATVIETISYRWWILVAAAGAWITAAVCVQGAGAPGGFIQEYPHLPNVDLAGVLNLAPIPGLLVAEAWLGERPSPAAAGR